MFSVLWSEHCGYKHSAPLLRALPSSGPRVLQGPGENAGVIDLGGGTAVAFKVESHNHPSAVEPFQGASTGVGGILRDIVAMGARPVALLDGLRFGAPDWHFRRAVAGIAHYGNSVGVPTVGGETVFAADYAANPLVNAMCVGLLPTERVLRAKATGPGNALVLYGALTGRDGIGGASVLASQDLEGSDDKRPTVQIGDPFRGKALIEVSLDLVESELVVGLQDCGAAGLASSLAEMAGSGAGVDVHLDRVPLREPDLEPWEIMISESQERMVAVVRPERIADVEAVCARWELPCTVIGEVADHGELRAFVDGELVGAIPAGLLTDETPRYEVEQTPRATVQATADPINDEPKTWIFEQYDHLVGSRTVRRPGLDAAVLRLDGTRGLARLARRPRTRRARPVPGGLERRHGGRAERRLRRRRAARADRLPQLREPRAAGDRLGARARDRGYRRGGERARHPRRVGQRLALQRDWRQADPADSGRRLCRPRRRRAADPVALGARRPARAAARRGRGARPLRLAERRALHARPRHRPPRRCARAAGGGEVERRRDDVASCRTAPACSRRSPATTRHRSSGTTSTSWGRSDVRRLRHPGTGS